MALKRLENAVKIGAIGLKHASFVAIDTEKRREVYRSHIFPDGGHSDHRVA